MEPVASERFAKVGCRGFVAAVGSTLAAAGDKELAECSLAAWEFLAAVDNTLVVGLQITES